MGFAVTGFVADRPADLGRATIKSVGRGNTVDRTSEMRPVRHQGTENKNCASFALAAVLEHDRQRRNAAIDLSAPWMHACLAGVDQKEFFRLAALAEIVNARAPKPPSLVQAGQGPIYACNIEGAERAPKLHEVHGENEIKNHLYGHGPLAVTIHVEKDFFDDTIPPDVYTASAEPGHTHAVCLVGYNDPEKYWIAKNSYGPAWSVWGGYVRIAYGHCMVTDYVAWGIPRPGAMRGGGVTQ